MGSFAMIGIGLVLQIGMALLMPKPKLPTQKGPRLTDLRSPAAQYGMDIPSVYGSARVNGNLIWAPKIIEVVTVEKIGGGKSGTQKIITYSYYANLAVALSEGPVSGIHRIWCDGIKVWDSGDSNLIEVTTNVTGTFTKPVGAIEKFPGVITRYTGSETQLPNALIESIEGVGKVPAFRGICYIVFTRLPLAEFGNRIPVVSAEVIRQDTKRYPMVKYAANVVDAFGNGESPVPDPRRPYVYYSVSGIIYKVNRLTGALIWTYDVGFSVSITVNPVSGHVLFWTNYDFGYLSSSGTLIEFPTGSMNPIGHVNYDSLGNLWTANILSTGFELRGPDGSDLVIPVSLQPANGEAVWALETPVGYRWLTNAYLGINWGATVSMAGYTVDVIPYSNPQLEDGKWLVWDDATETLILGTSVGIDGLKLYKLDPFTFAIIDYLDLTADSGAYMNTQQIIMLNSIVNGSIAISTSGYTAFVNTVTMTVEELGPTSYTAYGNAPYGIMTYAFFDPYQNGWYTSVAGTGHQIEAVYYKTLDGRELIPVSSIVEEFATVAGLSADKVDARDLDTVLTAGFIRQNQMEYRKCIEVLQQGYRFDVAEQDFKLVFKKRGKSPAVTIPWEDLAVSTSESSDHAEYLKESIIQEVELPRRVAVKFNDPKKNYDQNVEYAQRSFDGTTSRTELSYELPITMEIEDAKQKAEIALAEIWMGRKSIEFILPPKYLWLQPMDVLEVTKISDFGTYLYEIRLMELEIGENLVLKCKGRVQSRKIYDPPAVTAPTIGYVDSPIPYQVESVPVTLNVPPIDKYIDNNSGIWVSSIPFVDIPGNIWPGATVYKQADPDGTYTTVASFVTEPYHGVCHAPLATTQFWTVWDDVNTVTIEMGNGVLATATDLDVLNGLNWAMLGDELIGFVNVEPIAENVYRLSRLLRGRNGSEYWVGSHVAGEGFYPLDTIGSFKRVQLPYGEVISFMYYTATTSGQEIARASSYTHQGTALGLKAWAPCHIKGTRNGGGDLTVTWEKRNRYDGELRDSEEIPDVAGEVDEYFLNFASAGGGRSVEHNVGRSYIYTAAQQTTDTGGLVNPVNVLIEHQNGVQLNRGYYSPGVSL